MAKYELQDIATIKKNSSKLYEFDGNKYLVYNLSDGYFATSASCTHLFKSLAKGVIVSDKTVRCPLHRAEFDIRSGKVDTWACFPPGIVNVLNAVRGEKDLNSFKVLAESGQYYLHT